MNQILYEYHISRRMLIWKRNLRKALDYVVRSLLISSKIDKTDNLFSDQLKEKTDLYEKLSKQINQENMI